MRAILLSLAVIACLSSSAKARAQTATRDAPIVLTDTPQLFLDDSLVAKTQNLRRELQTPTRHARNPLIVQDRPWEQRMLSVYGTVLRDPHTGKFRCWYLASQSDAGIPDTPEAPGTAEYIQCYAESDDGIAWRKPNIARNAFGQYLEHNIVLPKAHGFCVLHMPDDPDPKRQYRGLGGNVLGYSADGVDWSMATDGAANRAAAVRKNDTSSCVVRWRGEYLAFVRYQEPEQSFTDAAGIPWQGVMRGVGLCASRDFNTWTPKQSVFKADLQDGYPWTQPYGLCVTPYGDVLIGLLPMLHLAREPGNNSFGTMDVQMVVSRDGRQWHRVADRASFMRETDVAAAGIERPWDANVYPSTTMLVHNDTVYIYYTGKNFLHGETRRNTGLRPTHGIGLATLPADRFVALRPEPADSKGLLETRPFRSNGKALLVNARAAADDLQVVVCDDAGNALPGFERNHCRLTVRDPLRYEVTWVSDGDGHSLADALRTQPAIALRFLLRSGELYSFQVRD